jgi:hypothetical protein
MKSVQSVFASVISLSFFLFSSIAYAGGGENNTSTITPSVTSSETVATPTTQSTTSTSGLQGISSTSSLTQLQNTNYQYSSTSTQVSGSSYNSTQCGISIGAGVNNSNTSLQQVYTADIRFSSAKCTDYGQIAEQETKRVKISVQGSAINACIIARRDLSAQGKNPNDACPPIDMRQFKSIME